LSPAIVAEQDSIGRAEDFLSTEGTLRRIDQLDADFGPAFHPSPGRGPQLAEASANLSSDQGDA
jgi:hypothetical protein